MSRLENVAAQFDLNGHIIKLKPYGSGNINRTFLLSTDSAPPEKTILQRINPEVFKHPRQIMENMVVITRHMAAQLGAPGNEDTMWQVPRIIPTRSGETCFIDQDGYFWRAMSFIDNTVSFDTVRDEDQARKAGQALGLFHRLTGNLDPKRLHDTLPGLHHTPDYLVYYDHIATNFHGLHPQRRTGICKSPFEGGQGDVEIAEFCTGFIEGNREMAGVLENASHEGRLVVRTIHGDPKISNILFDKEQGSPVSLVDLDTVKPGLLLYDIGDFLRSTCNPAGEEATDPETVIFDRNFCRAALQGYFTCLGDLLSENDISLIFDSIRLIAFELGLRFFTDFLAGNIYFRAEHESHNLRRAVGQFKLAESISQQETEIQSLIATLLK